MLHATLSVQREAEVTCIDVAGRFVVSGYDDGCICVWNGNDAALKRKIRGRGDPVRCLSTAWGFIFAGYSDGRVKQIEMETGEVIRRFRSHSRLPITSLATSTQYLIAAGEGGLFLDPKVRVPIQSELPGS